MIDNRARGRIGALLIGIVSLALTFPVAPPAAAQVLYGSLTGNVTDPSGAAVPAAHVVALNAATGVARETTTDSTGIYRVSDLLPGAYKVTVSAPGFKQVVTEGVRVNANTVRRVDVQLQLGQVAQQITVEASTAMLQADRADVNTQLDATELASLPVTSSAGRNYQGLYRIIPGFSLVYEGVTSDAGNPQRSMTSNVNGGSFQGNMTRIDGASNSYIWLPSNSAYIPPMESIQTVSVVTNSYDAEQGNVNGALVNVVTKSGTNDFHWTLFEYHTDKSLKAFNRFQTVGIPKPPLILNQYGASAGGPIKKNKLFFFADWEATKRRMFASRTATVINPAGVFDASGNANLAAAIPAGTDCDAAPVAGCVFDPNTGNPDGTGRSAFPGNIIPAARIDSAAQTMLSLINPTGFLNNDGVTATNNYLVTGATKLDRDTVDVKINYVPSDRSTVFGRYSISRAMLFDPPILGKALGGAAGGGQLGTGPSRIQSVGLGATYSISATMLIDVNAGYTRQRLGAYYTPDLDLGNFGVDELHIPGTNGDTYLAQGTPAFSPNLWNGMGNTDTGNPFLFRDNQYVANTNLSWMKGRHGLRFGLEHTRAGLNHFQPQGGSFGTARGSFQFLGSVTALSGGPAANKANTLAQFLLGLPDRVGRVSQLSNPNSLRWHTWSVYARDSWQVTSNLTVNYGVRWEYYPFPTTDHAGVKVFDPATGNVLIGGYGSTPLNDGVSVGHGQLLPRLGIAYRLGSKTVIRTGYGMSADSNNWRFFRNNWPLVSNADVQGSSNFYPAASLTGETLVPYPGLLAGIPAIVFPDLSPGILPLPNNVGFNGDTVPFDFRRGYIHSYNLTLQREFGRFTAEAAYVGARGIRLLTNENINAAPIGGGSSGRALYPVASRNWGDLNQMTPDGHMYYDSLQTKVTWRSGSSQIGLAYTLSKAINWQDNEEVGASWLGALSASLGLQSGGLMWPYPDYRSRNKALASFDRTHNLQIYGVYELPFGQSKRWAQTGIVKHLVGGWQINWLLSGMSGNPFTVWGGGAQVNAPGNQQTPDQVAPIQYLRHVGTQPGTPACDPTDMSCHYFDPSSFQAVPGTEIRFGTAGRNIVRAPALFNLDTSVFRDFKITERLTFQLRAEMFGVTNTPHLAAPGFDVTDPANFGVIRSTVTTAGRGTGTGGERQVWFAGKLIF
jgi:hypothetical protein